ncbi:hypothetical protein LLG96_19630 [bacterium]|nr:hypothetical protein [bacterium]
MELTFKSLVIKSVRVDISCQGSSQSADLHALDSIKTIHFIIGLVKTILFHSPLNTLIKFNLIEEFEKNFFKKLVTSVFNDFVSTMQDIISTDQFIRDLPSFLGSSNNIIRQDFVSAIGATHAIEGTVLHS